MQAREHGALPRADRQVVMVADDDHGVRELIVTLLQGAGFRTLEASTGEEALEVARAERPALLILDVNLPVSSGYSVCKILKDELGSELPIIFVSGERVEAYDRVAGLLLGGDDYVVKPFDPDELLARVAALLRRPAARTNGHSAAKPDTSGLTRREHEVLRHLASGLTQNQIAEKLVISPKTVGTHIEHVLEKLGVHTRAQAVAAAYQASLVDIAG